MLDKNDIKQIGTLLEGTEGKLRKFVREELEENNKKLTKEIVLQVGEFIVDRVLPQIDELSDDLADVKKKVMTLPDRDELARGLADVKGVVIVQLRKEDEKVNLLIKFLREKNILTEEQWKALNALHVFPVIEI